MSVGDERGKPDESLAGLRDSWLGLFGMAAPGEAESPQTGTWQTGTWQTGSWPAGSPQALMQEQFQALQDMMGFASAFAEPLRTFIESQQELAQKMTQWANSQRALAEVAAEWAASQRALADSLTSWAALRPFPTGSAAKDT